MASPYTKEHLRTGVKHFLLGRGLAGLAGFATVILLVRYMDIQSYAGFTALSGVVVFAGILAGLGLERALSRYIPEARLKRTAQELGNFIWQISCLKLIAALLAVAIIWISWSLIPTYFQDVKLRQFPVALAIFILAETLFQHFSGVLQALMMQKALTRVMVVQWAGRLAMIFYFVGLYNNINLNDSLWIMALPEMFGVLVFIAVIRQYLATLISAESAAKVHALSTAATEPWPNWSAVANMSLHNYGYTLLAAPPQGYFMKMVAALLLPTQLVAAYGFFINLAERMRQYIPLHLLYNLIEPVMIANYLQDHNFKKLSDRCQLLYKSNLLLLLPMMGVFLVAGQEILSLLTAGKYQDYTWLFLLVLFQLTVGSHVVVLQLLLNSVDKSRMLISAGIVALCAMLIAVPLLSALDVRFILIGPMLFSFVFNLYVMYQLKKMQLHYAFSWHTFSRMLFSCVVAICFSFAVISQIKLVTTNLWLLILTACCLMGLSYSASLWFFKAIIRSEVDLLKSFVMPHTKVPVL